jgi:tRNA threonylcarbamoyladenosine biosynthesis protein TsaE
MRASSSSSGASQNAAGGVTLHSDSAARTRRLGEALGALLQLGDMVLLTGDLGAGKTTLTQGIGAGLGVRELINSPTFTILKEYEGRLPLYHFDLYRIESPDEIYALGFDDYFQADGVSVVEWAERGDPEEPGQRAPWPESALRIELINEGAERRALRLSATGARGAELARVWAQAAEEV